MIHTTCGTTVVLDLTEIVKILSSFGYNTKGLSLGVSSLSVTGAKKFKPKFFCTSCNKQVPVTELHSLCHYCGIIIPLNKAYVVSRSGGVYCEDHVKMMVREGRIISILANIIENNISFE